MQRSLIMLNVTVLLSLSVATTYAQIPSKSPQQPQVASTAAGNDQSAYPSFDALDTHHRGYLIRSDIPKDVEALKPLRVHFDQFNSNPHKLDRTDYALYIRTQTQPVTDRGLYKNH